MLTLSIKPHSAESWEIWIPYRVQNFNFQIFLTDDPFEYLALLTFSLTSNVKTVLSKSVSNPISDGPVKSLQGSQSGHGRMISLDSRVRGNDENGSFLTFYELVN